MYECYDYTLFPILYWSNICLVIGAIVSSTALTFIALQNITEPYYQMLRNWDQYPIIQFYIPKDNSDVSDPGDTSVFSCKYRFLNIENKLTQQTLFKEIMLCCDGPKTGGSRCCEGINVKAIDEQKFSYLQIGKNNNQKLSLCAKYLKGYSFHHKYLTSKQCKDNHKMCGGYDKETQDYSFCVPENSRCPIQEIYFSDQKISSKQILQIQRKNQIK